MTKDIKKAVAQRLKELMNERGYTMNQLAVDSHVGLTTISDIISCRNRTTELKTIEKLCNGMGITVRTFFNDSKFGSR